MKIYSDLTVFDAALQRMLWIFDEFKTVEVAVSGGKDSTVVLHLALIAAKMKGRLPLPVTFLDQEAEWDATIEYIKSIMYREDVIPLWYQVPFRLFNATSHDQEWLYCWDESREKDWIRPKDPISKKTNPTGIDRFKPLLDSIALHEFPNGSHARICGMRTEESPMRHVGLTGAETYKGVTWGATYNKAKKCFLFSPIYDWSYTDVWKAIHENNWPYCRLYDSLWQKGVSIKHMRLSSLCHETAIVNLKHLQEIEPDTWNRTVRRMPAVNTTKHLGASYELPKNLPFMFKSWREYRDYLVETLVTDEAHRATFKKQFARLDPMYWGEAVDKLTKAEIKAVLINDYHMTRISAFEASNWQWSKRTGKRRDKYAVQGINDGLNDFTG